MDAELATHLRYIRLNTPVFSRIPANLERMPSTISTLSPSWRISGILTTPCQFRGPNDIVAAMIPRDFSMSTTSCWNMDP